MHETWLPHAKWQLVDQVFAMHKGKYSKKFLMQKTKRELYGWRKSYLNKLNKPEVQHDTCQPDHQLL